MSCRRHRAVTQRRAFDALTGSFDLPFALAAVVVLVVLIVVNATSSDETATAKATD
ncbi:hypothetical protein CLV47_10185 [Antricoccus suffuscus]|uniref:Uncharacterized protein n=1 Tax=Antricoccus suffuscus TaxID=1629062 RepID=A0A2T1A5T8_9ACTN|nr:hypothetical protein [Antricoccus suffuscus]PRZ43961.1 hypothetical protein CLV47_10185 [Antricoccus suffuscus]